MASYWLILELAERVFFKEMIKSAGKLTVHAVGNLGWKYELSVALAFLRSCLSFA